MVRGAILTLVLLVIGGFGLATFGLLPMSAARGHWPLTQALINYAQQREVASQARSVVTPRLDAPGLALRGAGHYETACRRCHGIPGGQAPAALQEMLPPPPDLKYVTSQYSDAELFTVIKNGLKFTGMPGWPVQNRPDEVWAMVAFLKTLPPLDRAAYDRAVFGEAQSPGPDSAAPDVVTQFCARCHGTEGFGRVPGAFPVLAGQKPEYLHDALRAFSYGGRASGIMTSVVAELDPESLRTAADYYGGLPGLSDANPEALMRDSRGAEIAERGIPSQKVPACAACHGPGPGPRNPAYPLLGGQSAEYIVLQLELFRERRRGGSAYARVMAEAVKGLTEEDAGAVARYYGAQDR